MDNNYSVLMSVYNKEKPEYLRESMNSIYRQTVPTEDFVLICDGPLSKGLNDVINEMQEKFKDRLHIYRLEQNNGLGNALNVGIQHCKYELVARMDSDDICRAYRCERQLQVFHEHPEVSIVGGAVEEFSSSIERIDARRVLPQSNEEIISFAKTRNPFNHPCVMYKKDDVARAGGYLDLYLLEDYYLWVRMLQNHSIGFNIQEPLMWMRAGSSMYKRRSGLKYIKAQKALFDFMRKSGFIGNREYGTALVTRTIVSISPNVVRSLLYKTLLRG